MRSSNRLNNLSSNPILVEAARRAIAARVERERTDAVLFAQRAGIEPDPWQVDVLSSTARQIILNCSRQAGKSTISSVLAAHESAYIPGSLTLLCSPSLRQSQELFRKLKQVREPIADTLPGVVNESALQMEFENESRIIALPGKEATLRGFSGVNLLVVDEASRVPDELYNAIRPMLAVSGGRLVVLSTPFGKRGFFYQEWSEGGSDWKKVRVPADKCPRISQDFLDKERKAVGDWWFKQEYMCEFTETIDSVFRYEDISRALDTDEEALFL